MACNHNKYRQTGYSQLGKAMKDDNICWYGIIVKECDDCGEDLSKYRIVPVKTADQYMRGLNK